MAKEEHTHNPHGKNATLSAVTVTDTNLLVVATPENQLDVDTLSASHAEPKILVYRKEGGRVTINGVPAGAKICIEMPANDTSSDSVKASIADQHSGCVGTKERNDAQVSGKAMEKLLSALKNALKNDKIASVISPTYKPVIEDAIEEGNRFLNRNLLSKKDEIEHVMKTLEELCKPLISALVDGLSTLSSRRNRKYTLRWVEGSEAFVCEGCKQVGWGANYECRSCSDPVSHFHEECMNAESTASHDLTDGIFKLLFEPEGKGLKARFCECDNCRRKCNACGKLIDGLVYYCNEKNIALHPPCFKLQREISEGGITFYLRDNMKKKKCACCGRKKVGSSSSSIPGWFYVSKDEEHRIHVYCAMELFSRCKERGTVNGNELVLKERELSLDNKKHKKGAKFLKIVYCVLKAIVGLLFGDPTSLLLFVVQQVISNF